MSDHVRALNMIDLEFRRKKYKPILDMWNIYHDHLITPFKDEELKAWTEKGNDPFIDLLYAMATSLGYEFSKVQLKRGIYSPGLRRDLLRVPELESQPTPSNQRRQNSG